MSLVYRFLPSVWLFIFGSLFFYFGVHFSLNAAPAEQNCQQNWACIETERDQHQVRFFMRNKKNYPITITLKVSSQNMVSDQGNPVTHTIEGLERVEVNRFSRQDRHRAMSFDYRFQWAVGQLDVIHDDDYLYRLPFNKKQRFHVTQGFNGDYSHQGLSRYGVDFGMPEGTPIHAAREGVVVDIENRHHRGGPSRRFARFANFIVIMHSDGSTGEYYHLKKNGTTVEVGDDVQRGQLIGYSGNTGFTSIPHLHFAVYKALANGETQSLRFRFIADSGIVSYPSYGGHFGVADKD